MSLFNKKPQVMAGNSAEPSADSKKLFGMVGKKWNKFNSMDQRTAYTWGAVIMAALVFSLMLWSFVTSSSDQENFSDYETRGYDLSNMPFSTDEAEEYLLANTYKDIQEPITDGLYTPEEKEERQAADAEDALEKSLQGLDGKFNVEPSFNGGDKPYIGIGGYQGASSGGYNGGRASTQVNQMGNASFRSASGGGMNGTFGPSGDFSNFKDQNKGNEKDVAAGPEAKKDKKEDAKQALYKMAMGSRAAAGVKGSKETNAKKALAGATVQGSQAFAQDTGAVDISKLESAGLSLDSAAPTTPQGGGAPNLNELGKTLSEALKKDQQQEKKQTEQEKWNDTWREVVKGFLSNLPNLFIKILEIAYK